MKKIKIIIFLSVLLYSCNVFASSNDANVTFKLTETNYIAVTKRIKDDITIFNLTNNILNMDLTNDELKEILSQKSNDNTNSLTFYQTLNILVTPIIGTTFDSLVGKPTYYLGDSIGSWVSSTTATIPQNSTAELKSVDSNIYLYGFAIAYRNSINDIWSNTIPSGVDLSNKTLEEKLATLLGINLEANPNGVVNEYKNLFYFRILPSGYNYKMRFDFYNANEAMTPHLVSSTKYLTSSLNLLDTKYVYISYDRVKDATTMATIKDDAKINVWALTSFLIFTCGTLIVFKKYGKSRQNKL